MDKERMETTVEEFVIKDYVPVLVKETAIRTALDNIIEEDDTGLLTINPVKKRVYLVVTTVYIYTNIELKDDESAYATYDRLMADGTYAKIEDYFYENSRSRNFFNSDLDEFNDLFEDMIHQRLEENSVLHIAKEKSEQMLLIFDETMQHVDRLIDRGDLNTFAKYLDRMGNYLISKLPDLSKLDVDKIIKGK